MKIRTGLSAAGAGHDKWFALDDDTYDGAEDSSNRYEIGYGATEDEAITDLKRLKQERWEAEHPSDMETGEYNDCPYTEAEIRRSQSLLAAVLGVLATEAARREADDRRFADEVAAAVERNAARCYEHSLRQSQDQIDCQRDHDDERQHGWTTKEGE